MMRPAGKLLLMNFRLLLSSLTTASFLMLTNTSVVMSFTVPSAFFLNMNNMNNVIGNCDESPMVLFAAKEEAASSSSSTTQSATAAATTDATTTTTNEDDDNNPLGLTPELLKVTNAFEAIGDDKLRYKQLLYMANQLPAMDDALKTPDRQVPGCLSTVHVQATLESGGDVQYVGDSDGLLTKGLVALLVRGLSGNTPADIQKVDPSFIKKAGISQSLTPGRNNGFLNMLAVMKKQALDLEEEANAGGGGGEEASSSSDAGPTMTSKYDAIVAALQKLQPVKLELTDNSHQHAGHAGNDSMDGESHFDLYIVADAFDGLNLVKRHQLVYMILGDIMPTIHALQIRAQTPSEAGSV